MMLCSGPTLQRTLGQEKLQHGSFSPELYRGLSILLRLRSTRTHCRHLRSPGHGVNSLKIQILTNLIVITYNNFNTLTK